MCRPVHDVPPAIIILVGKTHLLPVMLSAPQYAALLELTRYGHSVATNRNSSTPPAIYAKLTFRDAAHDNFPLDRLWVDAGPNEAAKLSQRKHPLLTQDHRRDNLETYGAGKPEKEARLVAIAHAVRLAGSAPEVNAYRANLERLFAAVDQELVLATGN